MSAVELRVDGLRKRYGGRVVLDGLDLTVPAGALTALIGRSGCGKTTLLRLVAGFAQPDAGTVTLGGRTLHAVPPERRRIGYVTQEGNLFPHLTVAGNVAFGLPWRARRDGRAVRRLLDLVGLDDGYARRHPHELSGGEQQRVALARALAPEPDLLLLDEPFSALDAELRATTRAAVLAALAATGTTAVLVTHDQTEALANASRVALLRDGVVVQEGRPEELYRAPADPATAAFLGELTEIPAVLRGDTADTVVGPIRLPEPRHGPGRVVVRPEQLAVVAAGSGHLDVTVSEVRFQGHDGLVRVRLEQPALELTARCPGHLLPVPGQRVGLRLTGAALFAAEPLTEAPRDNAGIRPGSPA